MKTRTFVGFRFVQREARSTLPLFAFVARVKDVAQWAGVRRTIDSANGTQRVVRPARVRAITRFLKTDTTNVVPNSILVCFQPNITKFTPLTAFGSCFKGDVTNGCDGRTQWGSLSFAFDEKAALHDRPALVVDGQHRLLGLSGYAGEDVPILVVALLEASVQEQAFQFIVINNKAVRVPTDNVKAILAGVNEKALTERLLKAGVHYGDVSPVLREVNDLASSPFRKLLDWDYNRNGTRLIALTAVEQALRYVTVEFPNFVDDEDSMLAFFFAVWRGVKCAFPKLWGKDNAFMKKVSMNALNEFMMHRMKMAWEFSLVDIFEPDKVEAQALSTAEMLTAEFWIKPWSIKIQDNANVRNLIVKDIEKIIENRKLKRPWSEDLSLLSSSGDRNDGDDATI